HVDLFGANLTGAKLRGSKYNTETIWPKDFDSKTVGAVLVE
ncbi:MAG: pentapeptide repeat-containing protein, partial [Candidatus Magasanikbacteria bacterium]|nr:pentapeptide repeat-containing protein [Candidatus Magasanikbacteria bacterium]